MDNLTKKLLSISTKCIVVSFFIASYIILFYKNHQDYINNRKILFVSEIIAWIPLVTCVFGGIIYSFVLFSEELRNIRSKIYLSLFFQFAIFVLIMLPSELMEKVDYKINIALLVPMFTGIILLQKKIEGELAEKNFSIKREFMIMDEVSEKVKKTVFYKWSTLFDKMFWLFVIPFIIQPSALLFSWIVGVIAALLLYPLVKYIECYKSIADSQMCKMNLVLVVLNFVLSTTGGIILYCFCDFKLISFMVLYSSSLSKLMFDKKYALFIRTKLIYSNNESHINEKSF